MSGMPVFLVSSPQPEEQDAHNSQSNNAKDNAQYYCQYHITMLLFLMPVVSPCRRRRLRGAARSGF